MSQSRARYLMNQLIANSLSREELDELLSTLGIDQMAAGYAEVLEQYFMDMLNESLINQNEKTNDGTNEP